MGKRGRAEPAPTPPFGPWQPMKGARNAKASSCPTGSDEWLQDFAEKLNDRAGPSSIPELFTWPERHVDLATTTACSGGWRRMASLRAHLRMGLQIDSHHSGTGNGAESARLLCEVFQRKGCATERTLEVHSACDVGKAQQEVLLKSGLAKHVFSDLLGRLRPNWCDTLRSMMPEQGVPKETAMAAYKEMYELMLKNETDLFLDTSYCVKCDACCPVSGKLTDKKLRILIAGTECKAWSASGRQQRQCHPSMLTFLVFVFDLRRQDYDLGIHEITELHLDEVLPFFLPEHKCVVIRLSPWALGWPINRPRKYTIISKASLNFEGSHDAFMQIFGQRVSLSASDLWVAPHEEVERAFDQKPVSKSMVPLPGAPKDFSKLLTPFQKQRIVTAMSKAKVDTDRLIIDISKSPACTTPSLFVPTLLCSSLPWSEPLQRWAMTKGGLAFQGIPCYPATSTSHECAWVQTADISDSAMRELAGNAMFMPAVGTVLLYALGGTPAIMDRSSSTSRHARSMTSALDSDDCLDME